MNDRIAPDTSELAAEWRYFVETGDASRLVAMGQMDADVAREYERLTP